MSVYDPIASQYKRDREKPVFSYVETYTYLKLFGDISGKSILDLGCGEGIHSREFKKQGADRVVGVDISSKMLELAQEEEDKNPIGVEYLLGDMQELGQIGSFDLVSASYSINHARTKAELAKMCQTIYTNLKPGGRFIGVNNNLEVYLKLSSEIYECLQKYGYHRRKIDSSSMEDGMPISVFNYEINGETVTIDDYYLSNQTYEQAFADAGFQETIWHQPMVSPAGIQKYGAEFWEDLLENPLLVFIECQK
jgi:ubiquinone/menaquinone biosynthesis C-methylase UbiE